MTYQFIHHLRLLFIFGMLLVLASCSDDMDDDNQPKSQDHEHEEELITTVTLEFQTGTEEKQTFTWEEDHDHEEGRSMADEEGEKEKGERITLKENTIYTLTIVLLNEEEDPEENITEEIEKEKDVHQFFFLPESSVKATYKYGDKDSKDLPVGLTGTFTTQGASQGDLRVVLRHEPAKKSTSGELTNDVGGETDIDIEFPIEIQK